MYKGGIDMYNEFGLDREAEQYENWLEAEGLKNEKCSNCESQELDYKKDQNLATGKYFYYAKCKECGEEF